MTEPQVWTLLTLFAATPATMVGLVLRVLTARMDRLEVRIDGVRDELGARIYGVRDELGARIDESNARIDGVHRELSARIEGARVELGQRIDLLDRDVQKVIEKVFGP